MGAANHHRQRRRVLRGNAAARSQVGARIRARVHPGPAVDRDHVDVRARRLSAHPVQHGDVLLVRTAGRGTPRRARLSHAVLRQRDRRGAALAGHAVDPDDSDRRRLGRDHGHRHGLCAVLAAGAVLPVRLAAGGGLAAHPDLRRPRPRWGDRDRRGRDRPLRPSRRAARATCMSPCGRCARPLASGGARSPRRPRHGCLATGSSSSDGRKFDSTICIPSTETRSSGSGTRSSGVARAVSRRRSERRSTGLPA